MTGSEPAEPRKKKYQPTKMTPQVRATILKAVGLGASYTAAAGAAGISLDTLTAWRKKDSALSADIARAEGEMQMRNLACIQLAAPKQWSAAAWLLSKRFAEFRDSASVAISNPDGSPVQADNSLALTIVSSTQALDGYHSAIAALGQDAKARVDEINVTPNGKQHRET